MDEGEDWMFHIIQEGLLPHSALNSTEYDLGDFVACAEYLDVRVENAARQNRMRAEALAARTKRR